MVTSNEVTGRLRDQHDTTVQGIKSKLMTVADEVLEKKNRIIQLEVCVRFHFLSAQV